MEDYKDDIPNLKTEKARRIRLPKNYIWILVLVIIIALAALAFMIYKNPAILGPLQGFKVGPVSLPKADPNEEAKRVAAQVGKLIKLPDGETPTVVSVVDITKLSDQPFFRNGKNGNKLLIFPTSGRAILYDPKANLIIEVGPLINNNPATQQQTARIALKNGTGVAGLTNKVEGTIRKSFPAANIVSKDNANNTSYDKTIVIALNDAARVAADNLAKAMNASVSNLPAGEDRPAGVEILVIIGKDQI